MINRKKTILEEYDSNVKKYEYLRDVATNLIKELLREESINSITGRVKQRVSVEGKIDRKGGKYQHIDDMTDIVGIRIITYYSDDVDRIADVIEKEFMVDRDNSIDKRKVMEPDTFGYLSLHYVVNLSEQRQELSEYLSVKDIKFEIQIRTILQHTWAEIEHDLGYKSATGIPKEIRRDFSRLAGLLELADKEFLGIRTNLQSYSEEITKKVEQDDMERVLLDYVSLSNYVKKSKTLQEMNTKIAHSKSSKIYEAQQALYLYILNELKWLQCDDMKALEEMIDRNKELAMNLAERILENEDSFPETISLFYICYAQIINSGGSKDDIVDFLYENGFIDDAEESNEEFAERLMQVKASC